MGHVKGEYKVWCWICGDVKLRGQTVLNRDKRLICKEHVGASTNKIEYKEFTPNLGRPRGLFNNVTETFQGPELTWELVTMKWEAIDCVWEDV